MCFRLALLAKQRFAAPREHPFPEETEIGSHGWNRPCVLRSEVTAAWRTRGQPLSYSRSTYRVETRRSGDPTRCAPLCCSNRLFLLPFNRLTHSSRTAVRIYSLVASKIQKRLDYHFYRMGMSLTQVTPTDCGLGVPECGWTIP